MTKMKRLQKEAEKACEFRRHVISRFRQHSCLADITSAICKICGKQVVCKTKPQPNDIEIGGEAVALNCKD